MNTQPAVRFHDPPVTECTSMDVDDSSESRMSLGIHLNHVYLGPDEELDSDSGSSRGPDVLDAIPDPSFPAQADDLALFNDPDLYLRPEDDLIECDDAPAGTGLTHDCSSGGVRGTPEFATQPLRDVNLTQPDLTNEELQCHDSGVHANRFLMIKPKIAWVDYQQQADRPFRMAWAETSDKPSKSRYGPPENAKTHYYIQSDSRHGARDL
ncbi:hypothetical protein F4604DRAFT_1686003 [Suillus subluteus]|nr:hypothetical protein F4604DRAFT_1686003 [Suillus subluteus]